MNLYSNIRSLWRTVFLIPSLLLLCETASIGEKSPCNPTVDIVFMLDGQSSVSSRDFQKQKDFIRNILERHESPARAVQIGFVVCGNGNVSTSGFRSSTFDVLENVRKLEKPSSDKTPKRTDQCIRAINTVFSLGGREGVKKIAVLLIGEDNSWSDKATKAHVQEAKDNHVSILVITTGNKNFTRLHSLRNIASDDGKFFVLTSFKGLQPLSNDLSTGSCLPIALDFSAKKDKTTEAPATSPRQVSISDVRCRSSGISAFEKLIPFFGWIRVNCANNERVDLIKCECGTSQTIQTQGEDITTSSPVVTKPFKVPNNILNTAVKSALKTHSTVPHQTFTTSEAPVDPSPNKMTSSFQKTHSTTASTSFDTTVSKIKSTTYPDNSVIYQPKVSPKIDLSIFLPPDEKQNHTGEPKTDFQTLFNLLDFSNSSNTGSNNSSMLTDDSNINVNDTLEDKILNSAIISLLDKDMEETKKTFEKNLQSSVSVEEKQGKLPFKKHDAKQKSEQTPSAVLPLALPSSLTIIDTALKTMSNNTLLDEKQNTTKTNETNDSNTISSRKKLISLLQAENSIQTNIISFLKNTTATKSDILDNYTQSDPPSSNETVIEILPTESEVIKNSSKSALLIKLLNMENTLQSKLISLLNKENFFLGHADYDYPDLPTLPPLVPDSTTAAGPTGEHDSTTPSLENITVPSDVMDLFKSDSELESAIAILMHAKSAERSSGVDTHLPSTTPQLSQVEDVKTEPMASSPATTSSPPIITSVYPAVSSTRASVPLTTESEVNSLKPSPTKSLPVVTTTLQIVRQQVQKLALPPLPRKQRQRIRFPLRRGNVKHRPRSSASSNMISKMEEKSKTNLSSQSKDALDATRLNVTRQKTKAVVSSGGQDLTSKVTPLPKTQSPSSLSKDLKGSKPPSLTVVLRKVVKKDMPLPTPKVDDKIKNGKITVF